TVEGVKRLSAEVQAYLLVDRETLRHRDVLVVVGELPYFRVVAGDVPEAVQRRARTLQREWAGLVRHQEIVHRWIEASALGGRPPAVVRVDVSNAAPSEKRQRIGRAQRYGLPARVELNGAEPPVAENGRSYPMIDHGFAFAKGKLVDHAQLEVVGYIEGSDGF